MECNDVYWTMKADASRPTLVHAIWDNGAYNSPLLIKELKVAAPERNQISISSSCSEKATLYYVVVSLCPKAFRFTPS